MDPSQGSGYSLYSRAFFDTTTLLTKLFIVMYIFVIIFLVVSFMRQTAPTAPTDEEKCVHRHQHYERLRRQSESEAKTRAFASGVDASGQYADAV